ncbi:MAG: zinc-dependent metalloprotease [Actinomycetota bacterium]|nr:zinc-dependent metalloprotease [Actinomycetota bacterium]
MVEEQRENTWDRSLRGINDFVEGFVRRMPLYRSLHQAFKGETGGLLNWSQAREIAVLVAQSEVAPGGPPAREVQESFEAMLGRSEELVREYSLLVPGEEIGPLLVFDRPDWIEANLNSFKLIFQPLAESYSQTLERMEEQRKKPMHLGRKFTHGLLTAQLGMVIGYLARNVLGQFDLGLPRLEEGAKLYIVYPNLLKAEKNMGLVPSEFRLWITLHEVTHAFEFASNPWLRHYLKDLMERYFKSVSLRLEEMGTRLSSKELRNSRRLNEIINQGGLISIVHSPEQMEILSEIQGFMSLVEGYSNLIMDMVGKEILPSFDEMSRAFNRRREMKSGAERFVERMLGFDLKLQQYQVGELFCKEVVEKKGLEFLNQAWIRRENLPTAEEIKQAYLWIERIDRSESERLIRQHI